MIKKEIKIFGAALDPLPSPDRLNLKFAYMHYKMTNPLRKEFKDPYDFVNEKLKKSASFFDERQWAGKIPIDSWLTPKPNLRDLAMLSVGEINRFLKDNGCWKYALMIADYINKEIPRGLPVMIGVDHSLTGGPILALAKRYPGLNLIILDSHFDVVDMYKSYFDTGCRSNDSNLNSLNNGLQNRQTDACYYECGNFLGHILEKKLISPKNLWILGVQDEISRELQRISNNENNLDPRVWSIKKWVEEGANIIFRNEIRSDKFRIDLTGPTYISIDMDVGSLSSIYSARFMNSYGFKLNEFLELLHKISGFIKSSNVPFVGLDIMEIDIHFLEVTKRKGSNDYTERIIKEIFKIFINKDLN